MAGEANWGQSSPGWGSVWIDKGYSELEGTPAQQLRNVGELPTRNRDQMCVVPSKTRRNMSATSHRAVYTRKKGVEAIRSVNMHQLGVNFVERVLDVRRRHTDDGKAAVPGE
jgi:hypothetical protein